MIAFVSKVEQLFAMGLISQQKQQGEPVFFFSKNFPLPVDELDVTIA